MSKRMMRDCLLLSLVCLVTAAQGADKAKPLGNIVAFDADEIEVRQDGDYAFVDAKTLGTPPIPIEKRDERNFLLITKPDKKPVWVNGGDVTTDAVKDLRHNCSSLAMSKAPDSGQYGMRGVGERCK